MKTEDRNYELLDPKTNKPLGLAVIGGVPCVLAGQSGISSAVQLIDGMTMVQCTGKVYLKLGDVSAWHNKEISDVRSDAQPNEDYITRLEKQLAELSTIQEFMTGYSPSGEDVIT